MRLSLLCLALSLLVVVSPPPAISDDDVVEQFGGWSVITRKNSGYATEPLCILTSSDDDPRFILANIPDKNVSGPTRGSARLDLRLPATLLSEGDGEIEAIRILIPDHFSWSGSKDLWNERRTSSGLKILAFIDAKIDAVVPPLALGSKLAIEIDAGGQTKRYNFDLTGSYAALVAFEKCLANVNWINAIETEES